MNALNSLGHKICMSMMKLSKIMIEFGKKQFPFLSYMFNYVCFKHFFSVSQNVEMEQLWRLGCKLDTYIWPFENM
jgi:hypothetical protein